MSRRLVLNADDFGYDPAVSRGIVKAMREGVVSSTTMMVNTPHSEDAAALSEGLSIGLHLNLARWSSLATPAHEFIEADARSLEADFVQAEALAQLDRLEALVGRPATHVDVHKHLHRHPSVLEGLARAAKARGLPVRSVDAGMRAALRERGVSTNDSFLGDAGAHAYWTKERFFEALRLLPEDGLVELMCHPGYRPSHVGSGYGAQREVELETFCAPEVKRDVELRHLRFGPWS
ncbi:MAG: ChbG/HpnK family deacetylase [Myxococcaceae bacterium]|nr:ChbG/HpnK family deacetylase [Myxococcaceae bacterium]